MGFGYLREGLEIACHVTQILSKGIRALHEDMHATRVVTCAEELGTMFRNNLACMGGINYLTLLVLGIPLLTVSLRSLLQ